MISLFHQRGGKRFAISPDRSIFEVFLFPDGHGLLERVDEPTAGLKCLGTMGGRYRNEHAGFLRLGVGIARKADAIDPVGQLLRGGAGGGRGRCLDNLFVERLWRSLKYEEVYLKDYFDVLEAVSNLKSYFAFYNHQRPHQALGYQTPAAIYFGKRA